MAKDDTGATPVAQRRAIRSRSNDFSCTSNDLAVHLAAGGHDMAQTTTGTETARQQVNLDSTLQATIGRFNEAFNRRNENEVASFWAEDGTVINPQGHIGRGPNGVAKVFHDDMQGILQGTTSKFSVTGARKVGPDHVLLDVDHEVQNFKMPGGTTGTGKLHVVILAQRRGDRWQFLDVRPYAFVEPTRQLH
jgi:uncharacterized protein (TIGR02246 family)